MTMRSLPRKLRVAAWCVPVVVLLAAVLLSPLALGLFTGDGVDWKRASAIGQTYGAASAVLSAIALAGVCVSIILQARANYQARVQAVREMHSDLLKMALDDPAFLRCWGPGPRSSALDERQAVYINLILSHWQARWDVQMLNERVLRRIADELFRGEAARLYWTEFGSYRFASGTTNPKRRAMLHIIHEQYQRAVAAGPAERPAVPAPRSRTDPIVKDGRSHGPAAGPIVAGGLVTLGAVALGLGIGRSYFDRRHRQ